MAKKPRRITCMFCGEEDVPQGIEDVFPLWLAHKLAFIARSQRSGDILPSYKDYSYASLTDLQVDLETFKHTADPSRDELKASAVKPTHAIPSVYKLPNVCRRCNNGWMSRLEGATQVVLVGLVERKRKVLTPYDQLVLATWAVKTALTYDAAREPRVIPEARGTRAFYALGYPLPAVQVLLGNDGNHLPDGSLVHGRGAFGPGLPDGVSAVKFVFQFDLVLVSVIIPFAADGSADPAPVRGIHSDRHLEIWPPQQVGVLWPSDAAMEGRATHTMVTEVEPNAS